MKITFIDPPNFLEKKPIERVFGCTYSLYPIPNIFSLANAALLAQEGFKVNYIDMASEGWHRGRLNAFLKTDNSAAYVFYSVNLSLAPDLLAYELIRKIKKDVFIAFCGPAPTYFARDFLRDKNTFVVRGEPEFTLLELIQSLKEGWDLNKINGLSFLENGIIKENASRALIEQLDELPLPARRLLKKNLYSNPKLPKRPFTLMQTSRNCAYRCVFCVPNSYNFSCELEYRKYQENQKPPVRMRSAANVTEEFRLLKKEGYRSVSIIDDQFLWKETRTIEICKGITGLGIEWGCLARVDHINENVAKNLSAAGCRYIDLGIESFNQAVLDDVKKDLKVNKIPEVISILKRYRMLVKVNLLLGISPLQTKDSIKEDIRLAKKLDVDAVMFSIAAPFPGTDFYQRAKENRWFISGDYRPESVQNKAIINYPGLSCQELNRMVTVANASFYFNLRFILKNLKRLLYPINFYYSLVDLKRKFI
jgi:radical SAM superfamily enzyme YgiQ (UPF0313 family)